MIDNINVLNQHLTPVLSAYSHQPFQPIHIYALAATATYTTTTLLPLLLSLLLYGLVQTERRRSPMGPRFLEEGVRTPQTKVNRLGSSPKPANPSLSSDPLHQQLVQQTLASPAFQSPCHLTPTFSHVLYFEISTSPLQTSQLQSNLGSISNFHCLSGALLYSREYCSA